MKCVLVAVACFAATLAAPSPRRSFAVVDHRDAYSDINKDLKELINMIPRDKIEQKLRECAQTDLDVQNDLEYAQSAEVKNMALDIEHSSEFSKVRRDMEGVGIDMQFFINYLHDIMRWEHVSLSVRPKSSTGGLRRCLDDIRPLLPMTKIKLWAAKKLILSSAFRKFVKQLTSNGFKNDMTTLMDSSQVITLIRDAQEHGVDLNALSDFTNSLASIVYSSIDEQIFV